MREAIVSDYNTIKAGVSRQRKQREEFYEGIINKLGGEIIKIHEGLVQETREREDSHSDIMRSLKSMRDKFISINDVN